jgi:hypothetical protein
MSLLLQMHRNMGDVSFVGSVAILWFREIPEANQSGCPIKMSTDHTVVEVTSLIRSRHRMDIQHDSQL